MRQHNANCDCMMCENCMERTIDHHDNDGGETPKGFIKCPGCRELADPVAEFVSIDQVFFSSFMSPKRIQSTIPFLYRLV